MTINPTYASPLEAPKRTPLAKKVFHLDYETFSEADLPAVGEYRYAEDDSTEILMASIARDGQKPLLWVNPKYDPFGIFGDEGAWELLEEAFRDPDALIYAHNAQFERAISMYRAMKDMGLPCPNPHQWRCTAAMARKAAIPDSLDQAGRFLQLETQKDTRGKALIKKFCQLQERKALRPTKKPRKPAPADRYGDAQVYRIMPDHEPEAFTEFCNYCRTDNVVEQAIHQKLLPFDLKGDSLQTFLLDIYLNDRGIAVNVPALENAKDIVDEILEGAYQEFFALTGYMPTQRQKCKEWLGDHGLPLENMQSGTITEALAKTPETHPARKVAQMYADLNFAAAKKVHSMLACVNKDGRVRGTLLYHGAGPGRWAGRLIQPQNFKKPTINSVRTKDTPKDQLDNTEIAFQMLCDNCSREDLEWMFGNALETIASSIRHFIKGPFNDADYNAIEARIVCWLAGQEDVLDMYRNGRDLYKYMAGRIYNRPEEAIVNPSDEREVGKRTILGCGFNMGWEKFQSTCWDQYGIRISDELAQSSVKAYRDLCDKVEALWWACDKAARKAITAPGQVFRAGAKLSFCVQKINGIEFLVMTLPSKRAIVYPQPRLEPCVRFGKPATAITFYGNIEGRTWGRVKTYGGKLVENATQGTAADVMSVGSQNAIADGYPIDTLVHDQALGENNGLPLQGFLDALTDLPAWADGLPIKAEGKQTPYYKKG